MLERLRQLGRRRRRGCPSKCTVNQRKEVFQSGQIRSGARNSTLVNATLDPGQASPPLLCTAIGDEATSRANMRCAKATTRE